MSTLSSGSAVSEEPLGNRPGGKLGARLEPQLVEDVADVVLRRTLADDQPLGDLAVAQPTCDQHRDLALARAEVAGSLPGLALVLGGRGEVGLGRGGERTRLFERERPPHLPGRLPALLAERGAGFGQASAM